MTVTFARFDPSAGGVAPATLADTLDGRTATRRIAAPGAGPRVPPPAADDVARPVARERVETALARVLASAAFRHSPRHRKFLRYVVEGALAGRAQSLKEVVIGLDVFERDLDGFDPRRDSIVRVEARRLRAKLRKYYDGEGRDDAIEIGLAVGGYVPTFRERVAQRRASAAPLLMVLPLRTPGEVAVRGWSIGLADQLVARLGSLDLVRVMAPLASRKVEDLSADGLGRDHGVEYVIDGSIARAGSHLRCTMFLSRTADHLCLWSESSEFAVDDDSDVLFRIQDRVADAVAAAVRTTVRPH